MWRSVHVITTPRLSESPPRIKPTALDRRSLSMARPIGHLDQRCDVRCMWLLGVVSTGGPLYDIEVGSGLAVGVRDCRTDRMSISRCIAFELPRESYNRPGRVEDCGPFWGRPSSQLNPSSSSRIFARSFGGTLSVKLARGRGGGGGAAAALAESPIDIVLFITAATPRPPAPACASCAAFRAEDSATRST